MKKYYAVSTVVTDRGVVRCNLIGEHSAEEKPANAFKSTNRGDAYIDWFDSKEEAEEFVKSQGVMKKQIFEMTSKMYQEEKGKYFHYSALNALCRAIAQKHSYTCSPVADKVRVEFSEGGHDYMVDATVEEFLKCITEGYASRERYYKIYNEELGYFDTDVFDKFEDAHLATAQKCRNYGVYEFNAEDDTLVKIYTSADLLAIMLK